MIREQFLQGARLVVAALSDEAVGAAWEEPSVLAHQSVGSLAAHVARGGVSIVAEYLDHEVPPAATYSSADDYYARMAELLADPALDQAVRDRGAALAATGWPAVVTLATGALTDLERRLDGEPTDRVLPVAAGAMVLDDYLVTRVVEQVVHLDDLARSLGRPAPEVPAELAAIVATTGALIGLRRRGAATMVGALFRGRLDGGVLPVM